jgi:translocation protein SEC62
VKRALRALQSPAYTKARSRNPLLPEITDRASLENTFKLLPMSLLALRVSKLDPAAEHEGHNHAPPPKTKRVKGLWTVKIEQQQECKEEMHYVWLYEGSQWRTKLYAIGALVVIFAVVLFPLWPMKLRLGVWYLSVGMLGLIGLFFAMAIVRLIIWLVTAATMKQSFILYPNLFEDVGFFDSFKPVYAWSGEEKGKKKSKKVKSKGGAAAGSVVQVPGQPPPASATTTGAAPQMTTSVPIQRSMAPRVEEVFDDE